MKRMPLLSDPEKRAAFDKLASVALRARTFSHRRAGTQVRFLGGGLASRRRWRLQRFSTRCSAALRERVRAVVARAQMRGADQHAKISITVADAYHGATRSLALREARLDDPAMWLAPSAYSTCGYRRCQRRSEHSSARQPPGVMAVRQAICTWKSSSSPIPAIASKVAM